MIAPTMILKNSYLGVKLSLDDVEAYRSAWFKYLGGDNAQHYETNRVNRDGDFASHVTVLTPKEYRTLKKANIDLTFPVIGDMEILGVGNVAEHDYSSEAWYLIVKSEELDNYRAALGLPKKDFHATLGFEPKDVHSQPKGVETIKIFPSDVD